MSALQQLGRAAGGQYGAVIDGQQMVEALGLLHVRSGDQHTHLRALAANTLDQLPELVTRQRIDASGGLVEDQQVRVVDQCATQPKFLLHAAGQFARRPLTKLAKARTAQQFGNTGFTFCLGLAKQAGKEVQVLDH